jgi:neutral ceramidase
MEKSSLLMRGLFFLVLLLGASIPRSEASSEYLIGIGSYDITGPAADVNMMGYANPTQNAAGIHIRQRARVFIVAEPPSSDTDGNRVVFVNLDACMASMAVTLRVLSRLQERYGNLYTEKNVAISGTHTHSAPGGFLQYVLYLVTSMGFVRQTFDALADGIELAIVQAHENLRPGSIYFNKGEVLGANINRSPSAYLNNPPEERAKYTYDVDKDLSLLKFVDAEWGPVGAFSWFAVHGTSMNRTNELISGDNKGAAARFMEDWFEKETPSTFESSKYYSAITKRFLRGRSSILGDLRQVTGAKLKDIAAQIRSSGGHATTRLGNIMRRVRKPFGPRFVAAFCQSNVGDTSPNTLGAFCLDSGIPCDFDHSTCNGKNELCVGRGPAYPEDHFESTRIIGEKQSDVAINLFQSAKERVLGKVSFRQTYVDMTKLSVKLSSGEVVHTCPPAVGFSFAAGTTDGPGAFDFTQGDDQGNRFWRLVGGALHKPGQEQIDCQHPKPVLIDTGEMSTPYDWAPSVLPIQILRVGQFIILSVPGEMTTMAGRRLREAVKDTLVRKGNGEFNSDTRVVIAGLTGDYSQYIATIEEYEIQRYEGASTLFGPRTLEGYIQEFKKLAAALAQNIEVAPGPSPPNLLDKQLGFLPGIVTDRTPFGVSFGDCKEDVPANASYRAGETVSVVFYTGCPRNDLHTEGTFALVELLDSTGVWKSAYDDDDWSVKFSWSRHMKFSTNSFAQIEWKVPETATPGVYRIRHFGAYKHFLGSVKHFTGTSSAFVVTK